MYDRWLRGREKGWSERWRGDLEGLRSRLMAAPSVRRARVILSDADRGLAYLLRLLLRFLHLRVFVSRSFFEVIEGYGGAEEHAPSGTTCRAS